MKEYERGDSSLSESGCDKGKWKWLERKKKRKEDKFFIIIIISSLYRVSFSQPQHLITIIISLLCVKCSQVYPIPYTYIHPISFPLFFFPLVRKPFSLSITMALTCESPGRVYNESRIDE